MPESQVERERLRGLAQQLARGGDEYLEFHRRRNRRDVRRRLTAAAVALVVAMAATFGLVRAFDRAAEPTPADLGPDTVGSLRLSWKAELPGTYVDGGIAPVAFTAGRDVFALTNHELLAFPMRCSNPCSPAWTSPGDATPRIRTFFPYAATNGEVLVVGGGDALYAYTLDRCPVDGSVCTPTWVSAVRGSFCCADPVISDGVVYGSYGSRDGSFAYGFPLDCTASCRPLWTSPLGDGSSAVYLSNDGLFVAGPDDVFGFDVPCEAPCSPRWTYPMRRADLTLDGDALVAIDPHRVAVFDAAACAIDGGCQPAWTADVGRAGLWAAGGRAVIVDRRTRLSSSSTTGCVGDDPTPCGLEWTGPRVGDLHVAGSLVLGATMNGRLGAIGCASPVTPCEATWTWFAPPRVAFTALADGVLFAERSPDDRLIALTDCSADRGGCDVAWTGPARSGGTPVVVGGSVFVWHDGWPQTGGSVLYAFTTTSGG